MSLWKDEGKRRAFWINPGSISQDSPSSPPPPSSSPPPPSSSSPPALSSACPPRPQQESCRFISFPLLLLLFLLFSFNHIISFSSGSSIVVSVQISSSFLCHLIIYFKESGYFCKLLILCYCDKISNVKHCFVFNLCCCLVDLSTMLQHCCSYKQ